VEATGVELITVLITRKLLIPGTATTAKNAPFPDPLYVFCTKILSRYIELTQSSAWHTSWEQRSLATAVMQRYFSAFAASMICSGRARTR